MSGAIEGRASAHAKVNLLLRILARDAQGYHGLETVFHRLELADGVRVRVVPTGRHLDLSGPALPPGGLGPTERNLAWRAATAYAEATGWPAGFEIEVEKRIPVGGGLGGGSADAGAVLRILDALAPAPLGPARLLALATPLGADVPFLAGESEHALAWSRGERLLPLPPLPPRRVALLLPPFPVPTADAYRWVAESRGEWRPAAGEVAPDAAALLDWDAVAARATNDFESAVALRHPAIGEGLAWLRAQGARPALLSGSGSTLFGVLAEGASPVPAPPVRLGRILETATLTRVVPVQRIG